MRPKSTNFASKGVRQASLHLGTLIRDARRARRMTQAELAVRAGTSHPTLIRIEAGSPATAIGTVLSVMEQVGLLKLLAEIRDPATEALLRQHAPRRGRGTASARDLDF